MYNMFCLTNDIRYKIQFKEGFARAVYSFACHGLCALQLWPGIGKEHSEFKNVVKETLRKIKDLSKQDMLIVR